MLHRRLRAGDDGRPRRSRRRSWPSRPLPFAIGKKRAADLNLSPADLAAVKDRAAGGCELLGLRYRKDPAVGKRFDTLTRELGGSFIRVEFEGKGHSTLTAHRQQEGVDRVLAFFAEKLRA